MTSNSNLNMSAPDTRSLAERILFKPPNLVVWIIGLYLFSLTLLGSTPLWVYSTYTAYLAFLAFLIFLFCFRHYFRNPARIPEFWLYALLMVWILFTSLTSPFQENSTYQAIHIAKIYLMSLIVIVCCDSLPKLHQLFIMALIGSFVLTLLGAVTGYDMVSGGGERVSVMQGNRNAFAWICSDGLMLGLVIFPFMSKFWRIFYCFFAALAFISLLAAGSRSSATVVLVGFGFYFFLEYIVTGKRSMTAIVPFLLCAAVPYGALILFPNSPLISRLTGQYQPDKVIVSDEFRMTMIQDALSWWLERPLLGWGAGTFNEISVASYSHTAWTELLYSSGIPGLFMYVAILLILALRIRRLRTLYKHDIAIRKMLSACLALILVLALHSFARVIHTNKEANLLLAAMIGISSTLNWVAKRDKRT